MVNRPSAAAQRPPASVSAHGQGVLIAELIGTRLERMVRWVNGANDRRRASRVHGPSRARASRHNIRRSSDAATKADSSRPSRSRSSLGNRNSRSRDHRNSRRNRCQKRK
jgi:hypothetical protein